MSWSILKLKFRLINVALIPTKSKGLNCVNVNYWQLVCYAFGLI
jgi:hypothetical protein